MRKVVSILLLFLSVNTCAQHFLKADGRMIRDQKGNEIILRGMGLGGWMLQEPYMLTLSGAAMAQYDIRNKIVKLVGESKANMFYDAWLLNHCTKADIDSMASWGFNSVRLPMHYNLFTLPAEEEKVTGKHTWLSKGFDLTDSLLAWCTANKMYLILDLHAAPGGQGNDNAISDRDPSKPSLWQSEPNKLKTIALWEKLAIRYANEKWLGGYDLINEPNWGFTDENDKNGCNEKENKALKELLIHITTAIRKADKNHIIFIEANCWANNYDGIFPLWDNNMVISFHKYWNYTNDSSIQKFIDYRNKYNVPVWMGESGENSNAWFTDAIRLFEKHKIGWAMWPLKKSGINNPLQVKTDNSIQNVFDYWKGTAVKPDTAEAFKSLMQYAKNTNIRNNVVRRDVIDAMFRQVSDSSVIPFNSNIVNPGKIIFSTDFDLGRSGIAYHDKDSAEYWVSTNKRTGWNTGGKYRNDGVDIETCEDAITNGYNVGWIVPHEWLQYSLYSSHNSLYDLDIRYASKHEPGSMSININGTAYPITLPITGEAQNWKTKRLNGIWLKKGWNILRVNMESAGFNLNYFQFISVTTNTK